MIYEIAEKKSGSGQLLLDFDEEVKVCTKLHPFSLTYAFLHFGHRLIAASDIASSRRCTAVGFARAQGTLGCSACEHLRQERCAQSCVGEERVR